MEYDVNKSDHKTKDRNKQEKDTEIHTVKCSTVISNSVRE